MGILLLAGWLLFAVTVGYCIARPVGPTNTGLDVLPPKNYEEDER